MHRCSGKVVDEAELDFKALLLRGKVCHSLYRPKSLWFASPSIDSTYLQVADISSGIIGIVDIAVDFRPPQTDSKGGVIKLSQVTLHSNQPHSRTTTYAAGT